MGPSVASIYTNEQIFVKKDNYASPVWRVHLALALDMLTEDGFLRFSEDAEGERLWKPGSRLARLWWKRARLA
jgi:hypothetical protein